MKQKNKANIEELVKRCRKSDQNAQYSLYDNYSEAMYSIAYRLVANKEEAEDILQNSFLQAFKDIKKLNSELSFGSWLKRIVINKSLNVLRQQKINFIKISENIIIEDNPDYYSVLDAELIKEKISELPTGCRTIFSLHLIDEYKLTEIAEMLSISVSTAKSQYARAKQLLKVKLQKLLDERQV